MLENGNLRFQRPTVKNIQYNRYSKLLCALVTTSLSAVVDSLSRAAVED